MSCCDTLAIAREHLEISVNNAEHLQQKRIIASSTQLDGNRYKTDFIVPDMHCAGCIGNIERGVMEFAFVEQVRVNLSMKTVSIIWDSGKGRVSEVTSKLTMLGFHYHLADNAEQETNKNNSLLLSLAVAGFAVANIMLLSVSIWSGADYETAQLFHLISGLIAIPTITFAGQPFFRSAAKALTAKRLNMDVPISLAVLLALVMSIYESLTGGKEAYFDASVTLLFFLLIGRYLDQLMRQKARGAVERLSSLSAKGGVLVDADGVINHIELKDIRLGMQLRVFAGERFPVNGEVLIGTSDLDRSHVTGESELMFVKIGDLVEAGTLNVTSSIDIKATTTADTSFLVEMQKMMEAAEKGHGNYVRIADRMARIYAPVVHLLAFITFVAWMMVSGGDWYFSIYTAIAVLIVTCPCALGLAVPVAHVIGANRLMQNGILMRDGTALERLAGIDHVVFDKTGTLTMGTPIVSRVHGNIGKERSLLKAVASRSGHPNAKAINHSLDPAENMDLEHVTEIPGLGIEAIYKGKTMRLGKPEWVMEISARSNIPIPPESSVSFAASNGIPVFFKIEDAVRKGASIAIRKLKTQALSIAMLSGDRSEKVRVLAHSLGIEETYANQTPAEKIAYINALRENGHHPLMIGDGINDAPALAAGYVSMVPASASDVGRQSADFVFTRQSLTAVPFALEIARYTEVIVKQNFGLAIAYNCIAIPLAMSGFVTPLIAALAMSASSIVVVANSFRINLAARNVSTKTNRPLEKSKKATEVIA